MGFEMKEEYLTVKINNKTESIPKGMNISDLLNSRHMRPNSAVWVNGKQLLLKEYPTYFIRENDEIRLIPIVSGG